jgi:hypothetical protein
MQPAEVPCKPIYENRQEVYTASFTQAVTSLTTSQLRLRFSTFPMSRTLSPNLFHVFCLNRMHTETQI